MPLQKVTSDNRPTWSRRLWSHVTLVKILFIDAILAWTIGHSLALALVWSVIALLVFIEKRMRVRTVNAQAKELEEVRTSVEAVRSERLRHARSAQLEALEWKRREHS